MMKSDDRAMENQPQKYRSKWKSLLEREWNNFMYYFAYN